MVPKFDIHHNLMSPDMTHINWMLNMYTNPWQHPTRIQRLMVRMTYNQDIKIYAPLVHQTQRNCEFAQCCYLANLTQSI